MEDIVEATAESAEREFVPPSPGSGPHVLIAEDDPVNQVVVQATLSQLGATSAVADNGRVSVPSTSTWY